MATPSLDFCNRAETGKTRFAQTVSRLFSARLQKSKRHLGQERQRPHRRCADLSGSGLCCRCSLCFALYCWVLLHSWSMVWPFPALCGALNLCCKEEKERRLFERSEFASSPSLRHKFKEGVAASGAPFFADFLWQDKESESAPAGDETQNEPPTTNPKKQPQKQTPHLDNPPPPPSPSADALQADPPPHRSSPHALVRARSAIRIPIPTTRVSA
jgi:hypothetical protein